MVLGMRRIDFFKNSDKLYQMFIDEVKEKRMKHNYIPGKAYKMRNGKKVFYIGENPNKPSNPLVFTFDDTVFGCAENGRFFISTEHEYDIIGEWPPEPKKYKGWMNVYPPYQCRTLAIAHCIFETKEECDIQTGTKGNRIACIPIEFTEGEGL